MNHIRFVFYIKKPFKVAFCFISFRININIPSHLNPLCILIINIAHISTMFIFRVLLGSDWPCSDDVGEINMSCSNAPSTFTDVSLSNHSR